MKINHSNERYFAMSQHDALKSIAYLSGVIGLLEGRWGRPQSALEAAILTQLLDVRETVRAAYEGSEDNELWLFGINDEYCWMHTPGGWTCVLCRYAVTLPAFFEVCSLFAKAAVLEARGEG